MHTVHTHVNLGKIRSRRWHGWMAVCPGREHFKWSPFPFDLQKHVCLFIPDNLIQTLFTQERLRPQKCVELLSSNPPHCSTITNITWMMHTVGIKHKNLSGSWLKNELQDFFFLSASPDFVRLDRCGLFFILSVDGRFYQTLLWIIMKPELLQPCLVQRLVNFFLQMWEYLSFCKFKMKKKISESEPLIYFINS